nr:PREDICTED: survival motor neuron protein-like isoform X2 [Bemisia tabaci]
MAQLECLQETIEIDGVVYDNLLLVKAYEQAIDETNKNLILGKVEPDVEMPHHAPSTVPQKVLLEEGMFVRALYSEDQKYYEATIIKVFETCCLVEFAGYKNREKVANKYIQKSLGKEAQQRQIMEATAEVDELTDNRTAQSSEIETDEMTECDSSRPLFRMPPDRSTFSPFKGGQPMIPPPIPPHIMNHFPQSESEIVSSMLLSWYMSGYHTGYWQGYQASKNRSNSGRSRFRKK